MVHLLVVANQTLGSQHLLDYLAARGGSTPVAVRVVVPIAASTVLASAGGEPTDAVHHAREAAVQRLEDLIDRLAALGIEARGELAGPDPLTGIGEILNVADYDEIVISMLPRGLSRWHQLDLHRRVEQRFGLPVVVVVDDPHRPPSWAGPSAPARPVG